MSFWQFLGQFGVYDDFRLFLSRPRVRMINNILQYHLTTNKCQRTSWIVQVLLLCCLFVWRLLVYGKIRSNQRRLYKSIFRHHSQRSADPPQSSRWLAHECNYKRPAVYPQGVCVKFTKQVCNVSMPDTQLFNLQIFRCRLQSESDLSEIC